MLTTCVCQCISVMTVEGVEEEGGWCEGVLNGKTGLFPSNFVQDLDEAGETAETPDTKIGEPLSSLYFQGLTTTLSQLFTKVLVRLDKKSSISYVCC